MALTGLQRHQYQPFIKRLANTVVHLERDNRCLIESACEATLPPASLLFLVDAARYDETPMKLSASPPPLKAAAAESEALDAGGAGEVGQLVLQQSSFHMAYVGRKASGVKKLLQSEGTWGFIIQDPSSGKLLTVIGRAATWLQLLERTTGEVLLEAARRRSTVSSASESFNHKLRLVQHDAHGANDRCEQGWMRDHGDSWALLELHCDVHKVAGIQTKTIGNMMKGTISGQLHFALAVNDGVGMHRFKRVLRELVVERLVIRRGRPAADAESFRRHVLRLCLARGSRLLERRLALWCLPNGDWRSQGVVEVYVPMHAEVNRAALVETVASSLCAVLLPGKFQVYPRTRWTRSDTAFDEFCLLEAVHGLASAIFPRWRALATTRSAKAASAPEPAGARAHVLPLQAAVDGTASPADVGDLELGPDADWTEGDLAVAVPPEGNHDTQPQETADSTFDAYRKENETHRREAQKWLDTQPLGSALLLRQCMEPLRRLLRCHLELVGCSGNGCPLDPEKSSQITPTHCCKASRFLVCLRLGVLGCFREILSSINCNALAQVLGCGLLEAL